jgi:putative IMPACT (imprinted ancient) family translation regulator
MWEMDVYAARAAQCQQKAKATQSEEEKQSWLAMADSWRQTAELKRMLEQQKVFIEKIPVQDDLSVEFWPR